MKKMYAFVWLVLVCNPLWAASNTHILANPFQDDLSRLDSEFKDMSALEEIVNSRNATYQLLAEEQHAHLNSVLADQDIASSLVGAVAPNGDRLLGISGFWWGCCFSLLGVLLVSVAVDGESKKGEISKAFIGCLIVPAFIVLLYAISFAISLSYWWVL